MAEKPKRKELSEFQLRNISILTHLLRHDAVSDEIVENLRSSELDYFSLLEKYKLLEKKVNLDEKTNLLKFKKDYLANIIKTASRVFHGMHKTEYNISFIRIDIDDFSIFNNKYGHDLGDQVLINIANILRENSRPTDYIIRFGGEEFDIILPATEIEGTKSYLGKIFDMVEKLAVPYGNMDLSVTISAGVSFFTYAFEKNLHINEEEINEKFALLQQNADNALYEAKYLGKNRYCIYDPEKEQEYFKIRKKYVKEK